ncbi:hypothetical protein GGR54DRAFT_478492 [Hypoxylon sp. NC1633]|nr:hypothetical protein GGR54DRAFT_478492 [Hypoxylon sp. NC1633]
MASPSTSTTDLPSGDPVPSSAPTPKPTPTALALPPLSTILAAAPSHADAALAHLQRCLQTPAGIDTVLLFTCYTSRLAASSLEALSRPAVRRSAARLLALARALPPDAALVFAPDALPSRAVGRVLELARRLRALSGLMSDARTFLRLWGLLNMYFWLRRLVVRWRSKSISKAQGEKGEVGVVRKEDEDDDAVETAISWFQLATCVVFQGLENVAYLSSKGVLGWSGQAQRRAGLWSARFWAAFVAAEVGRLFYESGKRGRRSREARFGGAGEVGTTTKTVAQVQAEEAEWTAAWRKSVVRNLAWAPLTVHWSLERGLVGDMAVGALASVPGVIQMRDLWKRTAE